MAAQGTGSGSNKRLPMLMAGRRKDAVVETRLPGGSGRRRSTCILDGTRQYKGSVIS
jgi:hypothetical protein